MIIFTLKKFENIKNSIKSNFKKVKTYIKEKHNKNIFSIMLWSQFVLNIVMTILLICSLVTTSNLTKQLNDISKQISSISTNTTSQKPTETAPSEVESDVSNKPTSSISDTTTSSDISSSKEPTSSKVTSSTPSTNISSDLELLACVIYQETGGNECCDDCRRRVADVVLNRVADSRFPNTIKGVLTAKNQYGKYYYTGVVWPSRAKNANEKDAVARAYRIAEEVLNGQHSALYGNGYVWQASFKQGTSQIYCCGTYFGK